jgi:RNA polymerase sigma-70 factor, ECF subfamily
LTTGEVAHAFLVPEATMGKRIVRAKRKIADARIPYRVPDREDLPARLAGVLRVIYLIFNEGYAASAGQQLVRHDLCGEAVRLGRLLYQLMPDQPEVAGLLSLLLLHDARRSARVDAAGRFVALADQDRTRWDPALLAEGLRLLARAWRHRNPGPYQLQAAIMAVHLRGSGPQSVDWVQIAEMYDALLRLHPSPVIELNRAVAVGFADGPHAGLRLLEPLLSDHTLASYQPLHASHADLLRRAGNTRAARGAYDRAIALSSNAVERAELERRREALPGG